MPDVIRQAKVPFSDYVLSNRSAAALRNNFVDFRLAECLAALTHRLQGGAVLATSRSSPDITSYTDMLPAEVMAHFDSNLSAQLTGQITGVMNHDFWLHGWAAYRNFGRVGLGLANLGLRGQSQIDLSMRGSISGTSRTDLFEDGFAAILEKEDQNGLADTYRIVCPSEAACSDFVLTGLWTLAARIGQGSHIEAFVANDGQRLASCFTTNVSYISDRLRACLRVPIETRPKVSAFGIEVGMHTMLASGLRLGVDPSIYELFPVALMGEIAAVAGEALTGNGMTTNRREASMSIALVPTEVPKGGKPAALNDSIHFGISVDGSRLGSVITGQEIEFSLPPGRHTVVVQWGFAKSNIFEFELGPHERVFLDCVGKGMKLEIKPQPIL